MWFTNFFSKNDSQELFPGTIHRATPPATSALDVYANTSIGERARCTTGGEDTTAFVVFDTRTRVCTRGNTRSCLPDSYRRRCVGQMINGAVSRSNAVDTARTCKHRATAWRGGVGRPRSRVRRSVVNFTARFSDTRDTPERILRRFFFFCFCFRPSVQSLRIPPHATRLVFFLDSGRRTVDFQTIAVCFYFFILVFVRHRFFFRTSYRACVLYPY